MIGHEFKKGATARDVKAELQGMLNEVMERHEARTYKDCDMQARNGNGLD